MALLTKKDTAAADSKKAKPKKSVFREWFDAALFAIVAATLIRTFFFEAYTIPSASMEGTMLIHDYLFVSKLAYGPRVPMTPLAVPLVHNSMPFFGGKSYSDAVKWGYHRLPGFGHIERNDVVVFNGPDGDSAIAENPEKDYYQTCRVEGWSTINSQFHIVTHPVDKKENLIKRCVGMPGDVLEVKHAIVYINGTPNTLFPHAKQYYIVQTNGMPPMVDDNIQLIQRINQTTYVYNLENCQVDVIKKATNVVAANLYEGDTLGQVPNHPGNWVYPLDTVNFKWNRDNYGPMTIPKEGVTVNLTPQNIALYRRVIGNYEGNTLVEKDGKFIINGKEATSYTFKMDYFWMMGDNRHESLDSRYWGFVPIDHVVGKAWFVWLSYGPEGMIKDMRWKRLLRGIHTLEQ